MFFVLFSVDKIRIMEYKVGDTIKKIRIAKGVEREDVANHIGLSVSAYGKIERGETKIDIDRLRDIADYLKVPLSEFVRDNPSYNIKNGDYSPLALGENNTNHFTINEKLLESISLLMLELPALLKNQNALIEKLLSNK